MRLPEAVTREAAARRRRALFAAVNGHPVALFAGVPRPRNYRANVYPFRPHSHFLYLLGWGTPGAVALLADGETTLFLPPVEPDDALWSGPALAADVLEGALGVRISSLDQLPLDVAKGHVATLRAPDAETREQQALILGRPFGDGHVTPSDAALADAVIALRLKHDEAAIAELRSAAAITAQAHAAGLRATRPGIAESVVRAAMEAEMTARGVGPAYPSIVTVHGEILHNETHDNTLREGDLLLADVGAESSGGWAGDVTRTWPVAGTYSPEQAAVYDVVLAAQKQAIGAVAVGTRYRDIHLLATEYLAAGLRDLGVLKGDPVERVRDGTAALFFPHGVGHLLGLDVHDMEDLGDRAGYAPERHRSRERGLKYLRLDRDLAVGMAVTIEPGIYFVPAALDDPEVRRQAEGRIDWHHVDQLRHLRGIRLEDDVLVTPNGAEVLTASIPKSRNEIETVLANSRNERKKFGS